MRCAAPADVAGRRLRTRTGSLSDADEAIAARLAAGQDAWPEARVVDTAQPRPGAARRTAMAIIRPHGPGHVWPARPYLLPD